MSRPSRWVILTLLAAFGLPPGAIADSQINRLIEWQDTNQLIYDTNTLLRHDGLNLSPCSNSDLFTSCNPVTNTLTVINVLGPCDSNSKVPCIENVEIRTPNKDWITGIYAGERNPPRKWIIWPKDYLPGIALPKANNLYTFPGFNHSGGKYYEVSPVITAQSINGAELDYKTLRINAFPVFQDPEGSDADPRDCLNMVEMFDSPTERCWKKTSNFVDWELKVRVQLPQAPHGWATGRIADATINLTELSANSMPVRLTVTGKPMHVPMLTRSFMRENPVDFEEWNKIAGIFNLPWDDISKSPGLGPSSMSQFLKILEQLPSFDRATSERLAWVIDFTWVPSVDIQSEIAKCSPGTFIGYAGSNSLTFESAVPKYDLQTSTLVYSVASPHYTSYNEEASGVYQLIIDTKVSRCLWEVTSGVSSASISVLDARGSPKVATVSMVERDDFTYFSAAGFGFSKSTIAVQLKESTVVSKIDSVTAKTSQKVEVKKPSKKKVKKSKKLPTKKASKKK